MLEAIKEKPALQKAHLGLPQEEIEEQMRRQLEEWVDRKAFNSVQFVRLLGNRTHDLKQIVM